MDQRNSDTCVNHSIAKCVFEICRLMDINVTEDHALSAVGQIFKNHKKRRFPEEFDSQIIFLKDNSENGISMNFMLVVKVQTIAEYLENKNQSQIHKFIIGLKIRNIDHCMYIQDDVQGIFCCLNTWGPKNNPHPQIRMDQENIVIFSVKLIPDYSQPMFSGNDRLSGGYGVKSENGHVFVQTYKVLEKIYKRNQRSNVSKKKRKRKEKENEKEKEKAGELKPKRGDAIKTAVMKRRNAIATKSDVLKKKKKKKKEKENKISDHSKAANLVEEKSTKNSEEKCADKILKDVIIISDDGGDNAESHSPGVVHKRKLEVGKSDSNNCERKVKDKLSDSNNRKRKVQDKSSDDNTKRCKRKKDKKSGVAKNDDKENADYEVTYISGVTHVRTPNEKLGRDLVAFVREYR